MCPTHYPMFHDGWCVGGTALLSFGTRATRLHVVRLRVVPMLPRHSEPTRLLLCWDVGRERILRLVRSKPQSLLARRASNYELAMVSYYYHQHMCSPTPASNHNGLG